MDSSKINTVLLTIIVALMSFVGVRVWDMSIKIATIEASLQYSSTHDNTQDLVLKDHEQRINGLERKRTF